MTAREELIRDLKPWAVSPQIPQKAQMLIIEAIGALLPAGGEAEEQKCKHCGKGLNAEG